MFNSQLIRHALKESSFHRLRWSNGLRLYRNLMRQTVRFSSEQSPDGLKGTQESLFRRLFPGFSKVNFFIGSVLLTGMYGSLWWANEQKKLEKIRERLEMVKDNIGGKFELVRDDGMKFVSEDVLGKWHLIYFGFTNCPDICPEELEKLSSVIDKLKADKSVPPIDAFFISVDPKRDSPEAMKKYLVDFSPNIRGLTGNEEQVKNASKMFRVYANEGPKEKNSQDYIVDHTIITYLMNPEGEFVDYFVRSHNEEQMMKAVRHHISDYQKVKKRFGLK